MAYKPPRALVQIIKNVRDLSHPRAMRAKLAPVFQALHEKQVAKFDSIISSRGVGSFRDSLASKRLRDAFVRDFSEAYRLSQGNITYTVGVKSRRATSRYGDPAIYYEALNDAGVRRGGPSRERVMQWLLDRGILRSEDQKYVIRNGKRLSVKRLVYLVKRSIFRKTARGHYRSLKITAAMVKLARFDDENSPLRQEVRGRVRQAIFSGLSPTK
jgi:hypothetical protein